MEKGNIRSKSIFFEKIELYQLKKGQKCEISPYFSSYVFYISVELIYFHPFEKMLFQRTLHFSIFYFSRFLQNNVIVVIT